MHDGEDIGNLHTENPGLFPIQFHMELRRIDCKRRADTLQFRALSSRGLQLRGHFGKLCTAASDPVLQPHFKSARIAHAHDGRRVEGDELPLGQLHPHTVQPSGQIERAFTRSRTLIPWGKRKKDGGHVGLHRAAEGVHS